LKKKKGIKMAKKELNNKPQLHLLKTKTLEEMARVRMFGIEKYKNDIDWMKNEQTDYLSAALRHIYQYLDGSHIDKESNCNHLAHAMVSLMLAYELTYNNK
jgi:hypothetical protein